MRKIRLIVLIFGLHLQDAGDDGQTQKM